MPHNPLTITTTLAQKYSNQSSVPSPHIIDQLTQESLSPAYITYRDVHFFADEEEKLRRWYRGEEFGGKIEMLSEYYKFHRDLPLWNDRAVEGIMGRYYNKVKDVDYKRIKQVLKQEQGISLTTHNSFSSFETDSEMESKKSRYSMMLGELDSSADEAVLRELCAKIGMAFGNGEKGKNESRRQEVSKGDFNFKGVYYTGEKKFEQYLKKQKKRINPIKPKQTQKPNPFRSITPLSTKSPGPTHMKLKIQKKSASGHSKSNSKSNSKYDYQGRHKQKENIQIGSKLKKVKTFHIAELGPCKKQSESCKSISSMCKPVSKSKEKNIKTQTQRERTQSQSRSGSQSKLTTSVIRSRSNSTHNLQVKSGLSSSKSKRDLGSNMTQRPSLRKSIPTFVAKGSVIELGDLNQTSQKPQRSLSRQPSHKVLQTSSTLNINMLQPPQPLTQTQQAKAHVHNSSTHSTISINSKLTTTEKIYGKKRNTVVESMLEKKLDAFKRKQQVR